MCFAGFASATCVSSQNVDVANETDSILDLPGYTVVASRMELAAGTVGSSLTTLTTEDLMRYETELASDVIRHVEGVYIRNNGNPGSVAGISMRGIPIAPVVLIDGVEVNDPGSGSVFNFGNLPVSSVQSIEVLRGAQSALYGSNALTGVISITTKKGVSSDPAWAVGASYGTNDTVRSYATLSQATERMNFFVTATFEDTDGYSVQNPEWGAEWADDDLYRNKSLLAKADFELTEQLDFTVFASYQDSKSEYDPGEPSPWTVPAYDNYVNNEQLILKSALSADISDSWTSDFSIGLNKYNLYAVDSFGIRDNEAELIHVDFLNELQLTDWVRSVIGFEYEKAKDRVGDFSMDTVSAFIENVFSISDSLHVTGAMRVDDNSAYGSEVTWRSSISYAVSDKTRLKGSYGVSYDAPEISELFGTWGNPDLAAESGSNFDVGIEHQMGETLKVGMTYFQLKLEDHIEYLRSTSTYANVDWESTGIETFIDWDVSKDLFVRIAHTWSDAKRTGVDDALLFHSPEHVVSLMLDFSLLEDRWNNAITYQYVADRETWGGPTDGFTVIDFSSRFELNANTQIWVRVENLLDETYEEILGYRAPGLGIFAGFKFEF